ncbi:MAG: ATP-binding protein [Myxococcota bacterium]
MRLPRRLAVQTAVILSAMLVMTLSVFGIVDATRETSLARDDIAHQLDVVAHNAATLSTPALLVEDFAAIEGQLVALVTLPHVFHIAITDPAGLVIGQAQVVDGEPRVLYRGLHEVPPTTAQRQVSEGPDRFAIWQPILEQRLLGWVHLEGDFSSLDAITKRIWQQVARDGAFMLLASVLLVLLLMRPHLRAVARATAFARDLPVMRGTQIPREHSSLEIEQLVDALNDTARRLLEQERSLVASEARYRALFEESKDVVFIDTADDRLLDINPAGVELFGFATKEQMLALDVGASLYATRAERERLKEALSTRGYVKDFEVHLLSRQGHEITALVTATAVRGGSRSTDLFRGILRDVPTQRQLEAQLRHAQRMEAVGRLTGGIAHDFNNILTAILGYASLLQARLGDQPPLADAVAQILAAGRRAAELTQSLLTFSRKQLMDPRVVDLNAVVLGIHALVRGTLGERVLTELALSEVPLAVTADVGQVEQVIVNLAANARDAMPAGGTLRIATTRIELDDAFVHAHGYGRAGHFAQLTVSDSGCGMDKTTQARIFEPFFTTKEVGRGTGLGLSTVYGIIKRHDGYINVYSEVGCGTVFRIYLPIADAGIETREPHASGQRETASTGSTGTETILVVEDDAAVRTMLASALEQGGYTVLLAEDGVHATQLFDEHKAEIDLLLLDIVLPKKNGREVLEYARASRPDVPALFVSGYTNDIIARHNLSAPHTELLLKPVLPHELLRKVRTLLDAARGRLS